MNKKRIIFITSGLFVLLTVILIFSFFKVNAEEKRNPDSYWSKENAPVFYGATKIQFSNLYTTLFDVKDARFRIFATDFEDGDLTNSITYEGFVDVTTPGTYEISYKVKDSHNNETTLVVPVIVTDEDTKEMVIERTLYTNPNTDNITKTGINRSTYHDRQMLGIFLPDGKKFYMKTIDSNYDISVHFDNRASSCEGSSIKALKNGEEVEFQNIKTGCQNLSGYSPLNQVEGTPITLDSIPFAYTVNLPAADNGVNKTLKIQIRFNIDDVLPLDYYHYKDNLVDFISKWQDSGNQYGLVDSERLQILIPLDNISKYNAYQFKTIDALLEYYNNVITHYDDYIGLELNPLELTDQNVRVKYFIKPNKNGAGAAYYGSDHVAANNQNIFPFFERNWGGLHEIAHGYQGSLGNGSMNLGEVSNNVLGHYAQIDKSIFDDNLDWLGKLPDIEETMIRTRDTYLVATPEEMTIEPLKGNIFKMKLYTLINLFDSFEGTTSFKKLNRWYRSEINKGNTMKNEDAYIRFFANEYKANIIPYFEGYNFFASSSVVDNILSRDLTPVNSLGDIITNSATRESFMNNNNLTLNYGITENSLLRTSGITTSLTLNIDIDEIENIKGKTIRIKDGNTVIKSIKVETKNITIDDLPLGTYLLQMPILTGYSQEYAYVTLTDSTNEVNYVYTPVYSYDFNNTLTMRIKGNSETYGYTIKFSDKYTKATVSFAGALIGANSGAYVKIYDENNNLISEEYAKWKSNSGTPEADEAGPYFNFKKASFDVSLVPGYVIEVKQPVFTNRVFFWSNTNDTAKVVDAISGYEPIGSVTRYIVEDGYLRREDMSEEEAKNAFYSTLRVKLISVIEDYMNNNSDDVIDNRNNDFKNKSIVYAAYSQLQAIDKEQYSEFIARITNGGHPVISYHGDTTYTVGDSINLYDLITATDNEDGNIEISKSNTTIETNLNNKKAGLYHVKYEVIDNDSNVGTLDVEILFKDEVIGDEVTVPTNAPTTSPTTNKTNINTNAGINKTTTTKAVEETTTTVPTETTTSTVYEETTTTKIAIVTPKTEEEKKEEETIEIIKVVAIAASVVALSVGIYFILLKLGVFSML